MNSIHRAQLRERASAFLASLLVAIVAASPVYALPPAPSLDIDVSPARVTMFPLGTARVELVLANPTPFEQSFVLEMLLLRPDGTLVTTYLSDALALSPGISTFATYSVRHAEGATEAVITPRRWPDLQS